MSSFSDYKKPWYYRTNCPK